VSTASSESATPIIACISDRKKRTCVGRTSARSISAWIRLRSSRELISEEGRGSTCCMTPLASQTSSSHSFFPASLVTGRVYRSISQIGDGLTPARAPLPRAGAAGDEAAADGDGGGAIATRDAASGRASRAPCAPPPTAAPAGGTTASSSAAALNSALMQSDSTIC
jgi:hypothetical protein